MNNKKILILLIEFVVISGLLLLGWGLDNGFFSPKAAAPQAKPQLSGHNNVEKLLIVVAPFATSKLSASEGVKIQEKIAQHMEKDLGLKVLRLSKPINMGTSGQPDLNAAFLDAEKIVADNGGDLLIWGNEADKGSDTDWNTYITASVQDRCLAREQGFAIDATSNLDEVAEMDLVQVLDWVTASWRGLIDHSQGMFYPETVQDMVIKTDTVLGMAAGKHLDPRTMLTIKRNLTFLLAEYGTQMKDVSALQNSIRLAREMISANEIDPETKLPVGDMEIESILGQSLFTLGNLQTDPENLKESAQAFQTALKFVDRKSDPGDWADLQTGLGAALAMVGEHQAEPALVHQAIESFEGALAETNQLGQPHQWMFVQTGLGASYLFLGAREVGTDDLKKALTHFLAAQSKNAKVSFPDDYATAETNIAEIYYFLGQRERSAEEMRQSILHSNQAVEQFRAMGNNYSLGFALSNLGQAQLRLAHYVEDGTLLEQSQKSLKESEELIPESQDANMWGNDQLYLGLVEGSRGDKASDIKTLQDASDIFEKLKVLYDPKIRRPMWAEVNKFQAVVELTIARLSCDSTREDDVLKMLGKVKAGMDPQKDAQQAIEVDDILAGAMESKGLKEKSPELIRKAYLLLKNVLEVCSKTKDPVVLCSLRSDTARVTSNLISQSPDSKTAAEARTLLESFEKDGLTSPVPADEAGHKLSAAALRRALANYEKNKTRLVQARIYATDALKIYQTFHYVFREAGTDMELGKEDLLLGKLTGDKTALKQAVDEFKSAGEIFKTICPCKEKDADDKSAETLVLLAKLK